MGEAAAEATGRHEFTAFTPAETEHVFFNRLVLRCAWKPARDGLPGLPSTGWGAARSAGAGMMYLEIEAEAFLRHMVRTLVGTMVEVGRGKRSIEDFRALLDGGPRDAAGTTAPAHGLFFWDVKYGRRRAAGQSDSG